MAETTQHVPAAPRTQHPPMHAVTMVAFGPPETSLAYGEVPRPQIMPHNEVLVEVHASSVNPFETKLRRGWFAQLFPVQPPHILGQDVAGTIAEKGFDIADMEVGDRVWGLLDPAKPGTYAQYVGAPSYLIRRMPANLSFEQAAAVPMAGCTAWHALVTLGGIEPGKRVLVHAGAGGVGGMAIQIAKAHGCWVAATASAANQEYLRELGADQPIDYTAGDFAEQVHDIDVVLDSIGRETNLASYRTMRRGGTMLVVLRGDELEMANRARLCAQYGVTAKGVIFSARPDILDSLRDLYEADRLAPAAHHRAAARGCSEGARDERDRAYGGQARPQGALAMARCPLRPCGAPPPLRGGGQISIVLPRLRGRCPKGGGGLGANAILQSTFP